MRYFLMAFALTLAGSAALSTALAADTGKKTVYLNHLGLEELRQTNPQHYARARQIMDAAAELCRPGAPKIIEIEGSDVSCAGAFLKTSNPPKRQIGFTLGDTRYIALVTMKDAAPTLHPAAQDASTVVMPAK